MLVPSSLEMVTQVDRVFLAFIGRDIEYEIWDIMLQFKFK